MMPDILPLATCAAGAMVTILAAHIGLWQLQHRLPVTARYAIGSAILGAWFTLWALWAGLPLAAVAYWAIVLPSGATVIAAYWLRSVLVELDSRAFDAGSVHSHAASYQRSTPGDR